MTVRGLAAAATVGFAALFATLAAVRGEDLFAAAFVVLGLVPAGTLLRRRIRDEPVAVPGSADPAARLDLVAASPDPVLVVDARAVVTAANEAARAIVPGLQVGHPLALALRAPEVLGAIRRATSSGVPASAEYGGRAATEATYAVRLVPVPAGAATPTAVALFFRDLSAERRLEAMRVDFVATVSHELRTPLASLAGFIDTLRGPARNDPAARDRFLDIMRVQADRMTRLVEDLLQLSRVELRAHLAPAEAVDLDPLVRHMVEIQAPLARRRKVEVTVSAEDGPLPVRGDRDELLRVVENLVENAVKYGGSGGRVEVGLRRLPDGRWTELTVRDFGPGVAPEHLPRLTERFYRVDAAESRQQGGTGLGLAIVKHIVGRHRGRLAIESEAGAGTLVRVQLPAAPGAPAP